jgi:hypothetical protein
MNLVSTSLHFIAAQGDGPALHCLRIDDATPLSRLVTSVQLVYK